MNQVKNKRTHTLKKLIQRQGGNTNLSLIEEDDLTPMDHQDQKHAHGIIKEATKDILFEKKEQPKNIIELANSIEVFHGLIKKESQKISQFLEIEEDELQSWINLQIQVPAKTILTLLRICRQHQLDPLKEEISFVQQEDTSWQAFITIEGWSKILNNHPQFSAVTFTQSAELIAGIPQWIECAIFRRDRILPITVREHYLEVRNDQDIWKRMPRRMLRHRALQQCARLAF